MPTTVESPRAAEASSPEPTGNSSLMATGARLLDRVRRRGELPVVVCIDSEPDERSFDRQKGSPWSGFERFVERLPALRDRLSDATGAPAVFSWFLRIDPQVAETWGSASWVVEARGELLDALVAEGDELALHTHTWRWDEELDDWVADYRDEAWAEHCVSMGLEGFESALGRPCLAHRGGDHFLSGSMLKALQDGGVEIDLTVEPGWPPLEYAGERQSDGLCPDLRGVPRRPYRSSPSRFPAPDPAGEGPLLVPLLCPPARSHGHRIPLWPDRGNFVPRLALEMLSSPPPVVALAVRSDAALDKWDRIAENLEHLGRHSGARFVSATEAAALVSVTKTNS